MNTNKLILAATLFAAACGGGQKAGGSGFLWQEEHLPSLQLWDFKRGIGHATDPREQVGSWSVSNGGPNTTVTHSYTGGSSFVYKVCLNGSTIGFCPNPSITPTIVGTLKAGTSVGCP